MKSTKPITVKELIAKLSTFDQNALVYVMTNDCYGYVSEIVDARFDNDIQQVSPTLEEKVEGVYLDTY